MIINMDTKVNNITLTSGHVTDVTVDFASIEGDNLQEILTSLIANHLENETVPPGNYRLRAIIVVSPV